MSRMHIAAKEISAAAASSADDIFRFKGVVYLKYQTLNLLCYFFFYHIIIIIIILSQTDTWHLILLKQLPRTSKSFLSCLPRPIYSAGLFFRPDCVSNKRVKWACSLSFGALWISQLLFRFRPPRSADQALTRQSLALLVSGERSGGREARISPKLWAENVTGAAVNLDGVERRGRADASAGSFPGVDVGRSTGSLDTGEGANLRVLPPRSHTHARMGNVCWPSVKS